MIGYLVRINLATSSAYLRRKQAGDSREFITPHADEASYYTLAQAEKICRQWQKRQYEAYVVPDLRSLQ